MSDCKHTSVLIYNHPPDDEDAPNGPLIRFARCEDCNEGFQVEISRRVGEGHEFYRRYTTPPEDVRILGPVTEEEIKPEEIDWNPSRN